MAVSSNSLFHYCRQLSAIKGILENGFVPSYCKEDDGYVPMVSFCDLPLSQAKYFLDNYGKYAIGMSLEWALRKHLNPVLYLHIKSNISISQMKGTKAITENFRKFREDHGPDIDKTHPEFKTMQNLMQSLFFVSDMARFSKPYIGTLERKNKKPVKNYKFYDEREWRYVPKITDLDYKFHMNEKEYMEYSKSHTKPHLHDQAVKIKAKDIKYLIVNNERDIPELIEFVKRQNQLGTEKQLELLTTRILTAEQIIEDF